MFRVSLILLLPTLILAQYRQQGAKVVGLGAEGYSHQGASVQLSLDGNTMVVGGWGDNAGVGAVWIHEWTNTTGWTQKFRLVGWGNVGASGQGWSLALSRNADTLIVGGDGDNGDVGAIWIYTKAADMWTQLGGKLVGTGYVAGPGQGPRQGYSVAVTDAGNMIAVGGRDDNNFLGATWIFFKSGNNYDQVGTKIVGNGYIGQPQQGASTAFSGIGDRLFFGGPGDNNNLGAVWVYYSSTMNGNFAFEAKITGDNLLGTEVKFGSSLSASQDGSILVVGGPGDNGAIGATWLFMRTESSWSQGAKLVGTGVSGLACQQGISTGLSLAGDVLAVGGQTDNNGIGATWIYRRRGNLWQQFEDKLVGSGGEAGVENQGCAVGVSSDGQRFITGGLMDGGGVGAVWTFQVQDDTPTPSPTETPTGPTPPPVTTPTPAPTSSPTPAPTPTPSPPPTPTPTPTPTPAASTSGLKPGGKAGIAILVLVLAGVAGYWFYRRRQQQQASGGTGPRQGEYEALV